ncbi:MAG: M24B family metallopeptidase, partial [Verrucomicrobiota bacterium]
LLHQLRPIKSPTEVDLISKACEITESGFRRILDFVRPGVAEYEIEAEFIHEFKRQRSNGFAYSPIIASSGNSCVLHYIENNCFCKDGDILLLDVGAEYANYNADMTRTIPVNGRFSSRQRAVYDAVLRVLKEASSLLQPGTLLKDYQKQVGLLVEKELIDLGLLDAEDVKNQDPDQPLFRKYFMHGTAHHLGLDVHDIGNTQKRIEPGMVFTCEPGIYIRDENLGIRLENNLLITNDGPVNLMKDIPIEADDIEALMNASK